MAEKVSKRISSTARSCNSKRSTAGAVRVVHISNPTIVVEASASDFPAVVQSLTGRKRPSPSSAQSEQINVLYSGNQYSPHAKAPKLLEHELQCLNDMKSPASAILHDDATVSEARILKELEVLPIQNPDYIMTSQLLETVEGIGDTGHILFDIFSPSILFSEYPSILFSECEYL